MSNLIISSLKENDMPKVNPLQANNHHINDDVDDDNDNNDDDNNSL
jgi:hypothetical protein